MADETDLVATLMRTAGRRTVPPEDLHERAFAAATAILERRIQARRYRHRAMQIAAGLLLTAGVTVLLFDVSQPRRPVSTVATVDALLGSAESMESTRDWVRVQNGAALPSGAWIRTPAGSRVRLTLAGGTSLRLAELTQVELIAAADVRLSAGKIYVDTGDDRDAVPALTVVTPAGVTRDLGTRFELQFRAGHYRLRVRDGLVLLERAGEQLESAAGEQLTLDPAGVVTRASVAPHAADWQWAEELAPQPALKGEPLSVLLDWVTRETGREIRYATPEVADRVRITVLHGNIRGLAPLDALSVMLATTDFEHVLRNDGTILVRTREVVPRRP